MATTHTSTTSPKQRTKASPTKAQAKRQPLWVRFAEATGGQDSAVPVAAACSVYILLGPIALGLAVLLHY